jgi:hypothetical protein
MGYDMRYVDWLLAADVSTQRMTTPIAVYTQLILLIMSGKPARNM